MTDLAPPTPMPSQPTARISDFELQTLLKAYELGRLMFTRPAAGTANPAVIAVTNRGEFFVKRRNPRYAERGQLLYDHSVIRHLAQAGLPVVTPVRTITGSRWQEVEEHVYEVYPLVTGDDHTPGDRAQIESAGETLAAFHQATTGFEPGGEKPNPRLHDPRNTLRGLRWARDQLASGASSPHGDLDLVRWLIKATESLLKRLPDTAYAALPACVIHADYHPANLKFHRDEVVGLFDFDWVGHGPRMVDVADGLIFFCGERSRPMVAGDITSLTQAFRLTPDACAAFGRGYAKGVTPTPAELRALPDLLRARWLFCRVDAMERKIPPERKLDYLLEDIEAPMAEIDQLHEFLVEAQWLGATG